MNSSRAVTAVAERRDDLAGAGRQRQRDGRRRSPPRTSRSSRALRLLPTTLRRANTTFVNLRATLDDLDVLVAESKPATKDLAPFLRELRPLVARRAPDDPRPAPARRAATAPTTTWSRRRARCRRCSASPRPPSSTRPGRAPARAAGARVHPPVHARVRRLAARLRPGRRQLRRQRPLRAHPADLQRLLVHRQPGRRRCSRRSRRRSASTAWRPASSSAARARRASAPTDGSAPYPDNGNLGRRRLRPEPRAPRALMKRVLRPAPARRRRRWPPCCSRAAAATEPYKVRAIFDNAGFVIPGEDVKVAGVKVGKIDSLDVTEDFKAVVVLDIAEPGLPGLPPRRRVHDPPAVADRREVRRVRADAGAPGRRRAAAGAGEDRATGRARASTCCRSTNTSQAGRPRPDQQHHAPAPARAAVDHPRPSSAPASPAAAATSTRSSAAPTRR